VPIAPSTTTMRSESSFESAAMRSRRAEGALMNVRPECSRVPLRIEKSSPKPPEHEAPGRAGAPAADCGV
jgi:hypothetical protein